MKRFFGLFKRKTTSSQSQSGGASGHPDSSSEEASKPEPGPTSPEEWATPGEIPSAPTLSPPTARKTTSSQSQSGGASGHPDSSSEEASKPEPGPTSPGVWATPGEIPSAPPTARRISRQERRRRERELRKMIRKRESHVFVGISGSWSYCNYSRYISRVKIFVDFGAPPPPMAELLKTA